MDRLQNEKKVLFIVDVVMERNSVLGVKSIQEFTELDLSLLLLLDKGSQVLDLLWAFPLKN